MLNPDSSIILTYYAINHFRLLCDSKTASLSLNSICDLYGYASTVRNNNSYYSRLRGHISNMVVAGQITVKDISKVKRQENILVHLSDSFFPTNKYVELTDEEINRILDLHCRTPASDILVVYLYVKSHIWREQGNDCAFYGRITNLCKTLHMTRDMADKCLDLCVACGLLVRSVTGKYKSKTKNIINAPNIYALNVGDKQDIDNTIAKAERKLRTRSKIKDNAPHA